MIDKDSYDPGEKVSLVVGVRDHEGLVTEQAKVEARFEGPGGLLVPMKLLYSPATRTYNDNFEPPAPGVYSVTVTATDPSGQTLGQETSSFVVGKPSLESEKVDLNDALLTSLASGFPQRHYYPLASLRQVLGELTPLVKHQRERPALAMPIWLRAVMFLGFAGLLSTEWALRKHWQLL